MFNKARAVAQKFGGKLKDHQARVVVGTMLALSGAASHAQETDAFAQAVAGIKTKITTYGGELVAVAAVGVVFMVAMKYVKKIPRAA